MSQSEEVSGLNIKIQRGVFDSKQRQLLITPEFIRFENKTGNDPFTTFRKDEIVEYGYGINWIRGFEFTIGREYVIFIKNSSGEVLKINFKSFYGINKKECHHKYGLILDKLWDFYFGRVGAILLNEHKKGNDVTVGRATLTEDGIIFADGGLLKNQQKLITWDDVSTKEYYTYLAVFSAVDPVNFNATFSFLNDWNTMVLFSVIKRILQDRISV